jgi:hypothetical protein
VRISDFGFRMSDFGCSISDFSLRSGDGFGYSILDFGKILQVAMQRRDASRLYDFSMVLKIIFNERVQIKVAV